ncbi:E3 ubiquitin-protein ligase rnf213-alpha-like [Sander lucioperca]|uniref:E3 ubiquitin-protein ligase rnf213-alpha-like n=1 Tax=Sander lucioperca TaxID=283035 RepID=UPI001653991B|nr:E3 ubiquitin-protein ligase rnf213-alpha-like [Sander lucioperca]
MFCTDCGNQVESSFRFCPHCGFRLCVLIQNVTQDVATSAYQPSVTAEERNQKEDQDQVPKGVKEEQENTTPIKGQSASDDLEAARDGATPQHPSNNTASPAPLEKGATPSCPNQTVSVNESLTTKNTHVTETCKGKERLSAAAHGSHSQSFSNAFDAPGSNLSVSTPLHSPTPASDKKALLGISREYSPEAVPPAAGLLSNPASSLTSTKETGSTAPESPAQTPQECDSVAKQSASNKGKDKTISNETQNLFGRPDDKATYLDSFQGKPASDDSEPARNSVTTQDPSDYTASPAPLEKGTILSFPNQTEQQTEAPSDMNTEDSHEPVQIPAEKQSGIHAGLLSNSASSPTSTKETGSIVPESSEQTSQAWDSVAKQPLYEQDKDKTISLETQNLSGKPDDNEKHTKTEQHTFAEQNDKKEDQAAIDEREAPNTRKPEYSLDPCPVTEETSQNIEAVDTKSNKKTNTRLAERQEQQPRNGTVSVSRSAMPSCPLGQSDEKAGLLVAANILGTSPEHHAPQTLPSSGYMYVYFHAVTSKDFHLDPEKDKIFLRSGKLFGGWDKRGQQMSFSRLLGDKRYLVEGRVMIPKNIIHESIPYKYEIWKHSEKPIFEAIYQKDGNQYVNRCLTIKEDLLTYEGEWHQYDDMIHPELKKGIWPWSSSTKDIVIKGRDLAGRVMLSIIFDLLTTWNEPNVNNFFLLLGQFVHTYSHPVLHDGMERRWGLPYGINQVEILLKLVLEENINHKPRMQQETTKCLSPFHAGVVSLLIYNKYLKNNMTDQLSSLCDILCLPKMPPHHFSSFWEDFVSPLADTKSVADVVEMLCNNARQQHIDKWVLVIPLIHLLRGQSNPFEPVPPVLNPQFDSWTVLRGSKGTQFNRGDYARIMKDHAYLVNIDRLLVRTWMPLLHVEDLTSFISCVQVELLDILHCIHFSVKSGITHSDCMALENLASQLINKESHRNKRFDDKYGECCLKTAVRLLCSICRHTTDPGLCDVPIYFLDLVCLIAKAYDHTDSQARERIHEESIGETLETMREWRRNTFRNKLLNDWNGTQFSVPREIKVWDKLLSLSFSHKEHTLFWKTTFMKDFEGKLKQEHPVDQIGIYSNKMEELSKTSPSLCSTMEKCALEAVAAICQDRSGRAVSALFKKHDITKFGKLMSVVVLKTWPTDASGDYTEGEDLIFEYLVNWPMAKTLFQMTGVGGRLINNLSDEAQIMMTLASSAFKSVSEKFLSGEIRMNTLNQILQKEREFVDLLKIDGLCDDRRCKDDRKMRTLLRQRKEEAEAVHSDKELVRGLLQICQELPQHVKVDFKGLDKKLHQNIEMMNLNTFMKVHTLDGQTSPIIGQVTYFNLCDITRQMATELHAIKDSALFKMCWMNQVEELSRDQPDTDDTENLDGNEEIYTLDLVYGKIFQSCYSKYKGLYDGLKSGELLLEEIDSIFEDYKGNDEDLQKDLDIMCRTNPSDDGKWIRGRIQQIRQYHDLHLAMESAKIIMDIRNTICPEGDFKVLEKLLQMSQADFKKNSLNCIDDTFIKAKKILMDITNDRRECLQKLSQSQEFVLWVKEVLEDINELKVFVDLASISAGENDLDVDRVACFHDAVLGYSSILYGLKQDSDFEAFKESLSKLWKALENDRNIPTKLRDTARHLEWLKTVKESHGSVEFSSLSLATSINEKGVYTIKAQNQKKLTLETSLMLQIQDGHEKNMACTYEDLKDLQNKLMLMSGRGEQKQSEVEYFAEVFDNVQRLAKAFVDLYSAGNPLFRCWEAKINCKTQSDPCIIMEINFCKTLHHIQICGSLVEQLPALSKKMEVLLDDWQNFMDKQRSDYYYLNYFTAEQIFYLCSVVTPSNVNAEIEDKALMMLSFIKPNCTTSDVWSTWGRFHNHFEPGKRMNEDTHFQSHFLYQEDSNMSLADVSHFTADNPADQTVGLKELEELWNGYMKNEGIFFHDLLDIRSLGALLKMMTITENQSENEWEEPVLSESKDNSLRRILPKGLFLNQPNLIICPHDEVLTSSICLYMTSEYEPLPSYDEVLLCTPATSYEQVELFLRRCLTPGDIGQKIYTMLWADQLTYDVSCAMEKCFQKLHSPHDYTLVIFCSSDREHTYIPTAFSQFKRDFVPQEPLERIQKYLSRHYTVPSNHKNAVFKGGHSVGIVASQRAGVGKSLYVQRLYEKLEGSVDQETAFKKCIRLTEHEVDDHKVLQSLYNAPKQKDIKVFHFDVTSSVQKGLNEFLFKLFFLRYLMDSDGLMWRCSNKHLYIIELLETTNHQARYAPGSGRKENFAFLDVFPKVFCRPPKEVMALEMRREENTDMESDDPLMDDECFRSEAYQRPYQYLTRFYNNNNLDNFTYMGIEGTHTKCLQILLIYCGIIDPSWAELRNFVWFLNLQLKDCENSDFCKFEFVGDTLQGFKNFVVEFMILMSKDFATPSLCITDQSPGRQQITISGLNERDLAPFLIRKRWESEPHPYIFFNDDHISMTFIGFHLELNDQNGVDAINPLTGEVIKRNIMTRKLYTGLRLQRVPFNRDFDQLPRADKIEHLCSVLGIKWPTDPDETYELTTDNILKMMAIHMRFRCGIPVIIMGETGCGKTRLIKFMCELRRCGAAAENMKLVKVHGGTTSEMIYEKVREAETIAKTNKENHEFDSVLFFDEANTTEAISSIKEIICDNSVQGQQLSSQSGLQIVAACNPYRKHTDKMIERLEASGLGYRVRAEETDDRLGSIPLRQLVYRVHVLPPSMIPLVWDFGQLNDSTEEMYIEQIVQRQAKANLIEKHYIPTITQVLSSSQKFMRERKDECSFVSLRDVERCMHVFVWFHKNHPTFALELSAFLQEAYLRKKNTKMLSFSPARDRVIWSLLMATGVCYQSCLEDKRQYQKTISQLLRREYNIQKEIQLMQDLLLNGVPMGETIARNEALKENFFMMVICVELRIPLFIVGKPGSSKSLSKTLIADAMQGPASHSELYKRLKQIHLVSFQCSPHSTPEGIINTFKQCARFQESKNLDEYISVVVLDEIGLAEDSPKMPLKTLHPLLEEGCVDDEPQPYKRVGFIGISNWALDPAKMNRGIFVSRGDPDQKELRKSAQGICSSEERVLKKIKHLFNPFAKAYMTVCEKVRGFFGLRDFYSLIKMIFSITKISNESPNADQITEAVLRNFSGKDNMAVMSIFSEELKDDFAKASVTAIDLVEKSIFPPCQVEESRYLLILTTNYAALQILEQIFFCHKVHPEIIFGSSFPKDQEYTQICRNINRVKVCMETGQTVVLLNLQNLYESLYDALNQYYVTLGGQKYVDLGLGTHRVKCRVHKNFRLIVIEEKEVVYEQFPIPLINRLEKHYLDINTVLKNEQKDIARQLQKWVDDFLSLSGQPSKKRYVPRDIFIGYHSDTCSSVLLQVTDNQSLETDAQTILKKAKDILLNCATPDSVVRLDKSRLPDEEREHLMKKYVQEEMHSSLGDYIIYHTQQLEQSHFIFTEVTTFSRLLTAADTQQLQNVIKLDDIKLLSLQQFDTEYSFLKKIREFLDSTLADKVLIIQTDYDEDSRRRNILSSAKYSCINEINKWATTDNTKTFVYFVTKLPRIEGGTSYIGFQGGPWRSVHIDDLRRSKEFVSDVHSLKKLCISELFEDPPEAMETEDRTGVPQNDDSNVSEDLFDITDLTRSCVQSAVSMLRDAADNGELSTKRVVNLLTLLDGSQTHGLFASIVRKRLHSLLKDYEANIPNPKSWVLTEASNFNALQEGGTFLHTLWRKIQAVVTPLLANLVLVIDRDCNLDLLLNECDDITNLWLEIFGSKEMLHVPYVRVESDSSVLMVQSHSTGGNTMHCRMPFSWWIKDFLDGLMMQTSRHETHSPSHFQELFLNTPLGSYMAKNVDEKMKKEFFERYLQDFVSMTMKGTSDEELQLLCQALASCVDEVRTRKRDKDELSLPHVHIAYHFYQSRLQNLSRMISLQPDVVSPLRRNNHLRRSPEMVLDVHAAKACVECLESANLDTDALCQQWLKQVKRLQASLELICSQHNTKQYGERCKERLNDVSNGWKRIYILSLFVEHMLLGFRNDENQLRTLVLNHTKTLSKVLEGNSDVKSMKAFQAVIKVLKSCKQGASDQLFRFGLQCGVCMREPQDPVELPCHHIHCSTCIRESLDAGQTSCPNCRQQLPDDFQPHVSEDISVSIKKNAEFRRRCNGFFIDLLSTVCFKDNTPPETRVITHLLSYLMVETEHKQIHTKDLSPFDESPDKNPVVRSVILKLLLKFSFDEVQEYLQQHLSSVEESIFVDEGDKAELYALYINCLEDSMWEKMPQESDTAEELKPFYNDETQFLHNFLADGTSVSATVSIQHLQHIARLRLSLTMAAQLISDSLSDNNVPDGAEDFLNMVIKFCEDSGNDWYRVYLIRKLSEWEGVESVQTLVKQPQFSWLFPTEIHQQNEDGGHMDQFLAYGEEYKAVRDAVAKAVVDGDIEQIEDVCEKCTAPPRNRTMFILLALFREVTTLYRSANTSIHPTPERCQAFGELIQGSRYLHQREVRDFASALVHNRLGALAMYPGHTIVDNTIIELIMHLAAVLLTGTHPLVMPLKQLGLSPENMQAAFIPTMPDDMLAVAQAAIQQDYGQLTWYVCPNNHPCFVDECGLPMQRGRCLECGQEVGGENHWALEGFRQIQLQQDNTRPGHILGDPDRRNNPDALDTKNISLSPFTLVRLVTHLAMLLGASEKSQFVQHIIQPPVEDVCLFLSLHIIKDLNQLSQTLGRGADDTVTTVHLVLKSFQELLQASPSDIDPYLTTKASRNTWETTVAADMMAPLLRDLDQLLQEAKGSIRNDSRVSSNFIMRTTFGDDCSFLTSLPQGSPVHSSAVWSCRERFSLLSLTHIVEQYDQKEELPLLWRFLQKEREFRQIKLLPDILILQKRLVRKFQNATDQIVGSIGEFIEKQTEMRKWYEKHIVIFLQTWNLLRVSVTSSELKIPDEFCSEDLDLNSDLQYLLPRRQGPGLCATGLVSYLVALHNELVNAVDSHTGEDSSTYKVSVAALTEQHVIHYELEKDLLPLVLSNCQYSLEHGHETISQYDLPRIQQQILIRFLQGKPLITRTGIPTLVNTQERDYETIFKAVKGKVHQDTLPSLTRNALSRELDSYSEVCEALKIAELLLGFLSMTGGDPMMSLVNYLQDILKMADHIDRHILQALGRCKLRHCVSLWQLLSSLKSESMLCLKREPFSGYPAEYLIPLTEEDKTELKGFMSRGNMDQWLLEMHEFLLLSLGRPRATDNYKPSWSVKETVCAYMDRKEVEVPLYVEEKFPETLLLSQIVETWKCATTAKHDWMMEG